MRPIRFTTLVAAIAGLCLAGPLDAQTAVELKLKVRTWRGANEVAILRELTDLLAIPNLASDDANIRRNAAHIRGLLERRGIRTQLLEYGGPPG